MNTMRKDLLEEIELYLKRTGMAPTTFGAKSCKNRKLVERLRAGGDITTGSYEAVCAYMYDLHAIPDEEG